MRRRNKSTREKESLTISGAKALAAGAAIAAGTQAYAAPIRFDNPAHDDTGHFHWPQWTDSWLDITLDAENQSGSGGTKFEQTYTYPYVSAFAIYGASGLAELQTVHFAPYPGSPFLTPFDYGQTIPAGGEVYFADLGIIAYYLAPTPLPEHTNTYIGGRLRIDEEWHYGWIGVKRDSWSLEAFAWGYETEPGVPIAAGAVPEPGTLVMLALGFVAAGTRRHQ